MPNLTFVLPHWLYWAGLVIFPLTAMWILRRRDEASKTPRISLPLGYFLLITGGFVGLHRFYLRSLLGFVFIPLFVGILFANVETRSSRDAISQTNNEVLSGEFLVERAQKFVDEGREGAQAQLDQARADLVQARELSEQAVAAHERWNGISRYLGIAILLLLVFDAIRLPSLKRRCDRMEAAEEHADLAAVCPVDIHGTREDPTLTVHSRVTDLVDRVNGMAGNFVAYWSAIAVFVYYYEVLARYVFNSPTNWAHESMFLMFGMQYLIAGGYCLREDAHVRVDVLYMHFSTRMKAFVDVLTSVFFFIFVLTLLFTGWTFFMDAFEIREVSFTEWAIQYWPVKFALPLGAALLFLQGLARLSKDVLLLTRAA